MDKSMGFRYARCAQCGRKFWHDPMFWAYRREIRMPGEKRTKEHLFCGWTCLCDAQRASDAYYGAIHDARIERSRQKNRDRLREKWRTMTPEEKERRLAYNREYYALHGRSTAAREKRRAYDREYYQKRKKKKAQDSV